MNSRKDNFLVSLGEDRSMDIAVVGGKGASLGKLVKAGFPVPPGFVVTTSGYMEFLRANDIENEIEKILAELDYENLDVLEKETGKIRRAIIESIFPDDLAMDIVQGYNELGSENVFVAVRSSATAEDLAGA